MLKKLYSIDLVDNFLVVVDGADPIETLIRHCPDVIELEDLPGYDDQEWPDEMSDEEIFEQLLKDVVVKEQTKPYRMAAGCAESLRLLPDNYQGELGVDVSPEDLLRVSKHGDMWSERWAE